MAGRGRGGNGPPSSCICTASGPTASAATSSPPTASTPCRSRPICSIGSSRWSSPTRPGAMPSPPSLHTGLAVSGVGNRPGQAPGDAPGQERNHRVVALLQAEPTALDDGLPQPVAVRARVGCGSGHASQFVTRFSGTESRGKASANDPEQERPQELDCAGVFGMPRPARPPRLAPPAGIEPTSSA